MKLVWMSDEEANENLKDWQQNLNLKLPGLFWFNILAAFRSFERASIAFGVGESAMWSVPDKSKRRLMILFGGVEAIVDLRG